MAAELGNLKIGLGVDTSGLRTGLKGATNQINQFGNALKGLAFAKLAEEAGDFVAQMSTLAVSSENVRKSFARFNDSGSLLNDLVRATGGAVSELQLMQQSIKAVNLGISDQALAKYFEFATIRAAETGESVDYLVTSIVNGVGRRSPLILDNLGIGVSKLGSDFRSAGDAAERVAKIIEEELAKSVLTVEGAVPPVKRLEAAFQDLKELLASSIIGDKSKQAVDTLASIFFHLRDNVKFASDEFSSQEEELRILEEQYMKVSRGISGYMENSTEASRVTDDLLGTSFESLSRQSETLKERIMALRKELGAFNDSAQPLKLPQSPDRQLYGAEMLEGVTVYASRTEKAAIATFKLRTQLNGLFVRDLPQATYQFNLASGSILQFSQAAGEALNNGWAESMLDGAKKVEVAGQSIKQTLQDIGRGWVEVGDIISGGATAIATSLGQAISGQMKFGEALLKNVGGFMTQLGQAFIQIGLTGDAIKAFLGNPVTGGIGLAAAGFALTALGTALAGAKKSGMNGFSSSQSKFLVSQAAAAVGGLGAQQQGDIIIYLNGQRLTQGISQQVFYNGITGG